MATSLKTFALQTGKDVLRGKTQLPSRSDFSRDAAFDVAAGAGKTAAATQLKVVENIPRLIVRGLQLLFGLIVAGFYSHRVAVRTGPEWVFGVFVAGLACVTAIAFAAMAPLGAVRRQCQTYRLWMVDYLLALMWIVVFGIFAGIYLHRGSSDADKYEGTSTGVQKAVVWLDLLNVLLWLVSGTYGVVKKFLGRQVERLEGKMKGKMLGKGEKGREERESEMEYGQPEPVYQQGREQTHHEYV